MMKKCLLTLISFVFMTLMPFQSVGQNTPDVSFNPFTEAGDLTSKYYPIGWSEDERYFALMKLSASNYASLPEGHAFHFLIKDVVTDKAAFIKSYSGYDICEGKFDAYGQGECDFSAKGIFKLHQATFTKALKKYNINTKTPLAYATFPVKNAKGHVISIQYNQAEKDGYIAAETLTAFNSQQGGKTILQTTYDAKTSPLTSEIVGAFVSPSKARLLVLKKHTTSGVEGERDQELHFIGCHSQKGYQFDGLVLTETAFGNLKLDQNNPIAVTELASVFKKEQVTKNLGQQDGPDFWYYRIGELATASTTDTQSNTLYQLWINDNSIPDQYGVTKGMTFEEVIKKRPNLKVSSYHYHIYLYEKESHIMYEMSIGNYNGPDQYAYDMEHLKTYNSKVTGMGWRMKTR